MSLIFLLAPHNKGEIKQACISKHKSERPNQIISLITTDD